MKDSKALLLEYLASIRDPERAASLFADDGVFELPFLRSLGVGPRYTGRTLPADLAIDAEVDLRSTGGEYFLQARLNVSLPGVEREVAQSLVYAAHQTCPYSKATRGNIDVAINVV